MQPQWWNRVPASISVFQNFEGAQSLQLPLEYREREGVDGSDCGMPSFSRKVWSENTVDKGMGGETN